MKHLQFILLLCCSLFGQAPARIVVHITPIEKITVKAGETVRTKLLASIDAGFHVNSDKQDDPYLIPLRLTWTPGVLEKPSIAYPKPETAKLAFSEKPVNIYTGGFEVVTEFKTSSKAKSGPSVLAGKLRFQACNDRECLIPRTIDVEIPVEIVK
jgi:hypothetical protein